MVVIPDAVTLWSCAAVRFSVVTIPDDTSASVVSPAAGKLVRFDPLP